MTDLLDNLLASGGMWLVPALLMAMVLMQGVKAVLKELLCKMKVNHRKWVIFICAYGVGFGCGWFLLTGPDAHKWSVLVGIINPLVYFSLVQWATAKNKLVLLSILKMRPLRRSVETGELDLDQTMTFMAKDTAKVVASTSIDSLVSAVTRKTK
jgi:hypothetical protein